MAKFVKGQKRPPGAGRKKGTLNRMTIDLDAALAYGATEMENWLKRTARKGPGRAAEVWAKVAEYRIPKLARKEIANADEKPFVIKRTVYVKCDAQGRPLPGEPEIPEPVKEEVDDDE
jgi:hypothetical protein